MHTCIFSNTHQYLSIHVLEDIYTHYIVLVYAIYIYIFITNTNICIYYYSCLWKPIPQKGQSGGFPYLSGSRQQTYTMSIDTYIHKCISQYQVLYTHTYIYSTYFLQECVCFRKHAHTAPEQQSNTNTEKKQHHIQVHSRKKGLVTCIHTDSLPSSYYIPILYQLTTIIIGVIYYKY